MFLVQYFIALMQNRLDAYILSCDTEMVSGKGTRIEVLSINTTVLTEAYTLHAISVC